MIFCRLNKFGSNKAQLERENMAQRFRDAFQRIAKQVNQAAGSGGGGGPLSSTSLEQPASIKAGISPNSKKFNLFIKFR